MIRDPDRLRTVWLFGKPYSWERLDDGRLTLEPAVWNRPLSEAEVEEIRSRWLALYGKPGTAHHVKPLDEENPMAGYSANGPKDAKPGTPPSGPAGASSANGQPRPADEKEDPDA